MSYTRAEAEKDAAKPENENRAAIYVTEDGGEYVAEWEGQEFRHTNPFGLDSLLSYAGVPQPRNLYLIEEASQ